MSNAVVIPVYNGAATLAACLRAVDSPRWEILVVDDASIDETHDVLADFPRVRVIRHDQRRGTSASRNTGWRATDADLVAFVDADVEVLEGTLDRLFSAVEQDPTLAGANGILFEKSATIAENLITRRVTDYVHLSLYHQLRAHGDHANASFTSICVLRRSSLVTIGGFDERRRSRYGDDVATRFVLEEGSLRQDPLALARHHKTVPLRGFLKHRFNIGFHFVHSAAAHQAAILRAPSTAVLGLRYPLSAASAALATGSVLLALPSLGLSLVLLPVAALGQAAASGSFFRRTLHVDGPAALAWAAALSALEGEALFLGLVGGFSSLLNPRS